MTEQAVVDNADVQSQGDESTEAQKVDNGNVETETDAGSAQGEPSLEELLAEYDQKISNSGEQKKETPAKEDEEEIDDDKLKEKVKHLDKLEKARQKEVLDNDVKSAIKTVKGDLNIPDDLAKGFLYTLGDDPRFKLAFMQRQSNPDGWNKVLSGAKSKFNGFINSIREEVKKEFASESTDAVESAVRSASTKSSGGEKVDFSNMSDKEFEQFKSKLG